MTTRIAIGVALMLAINAWLWLRLVRLVVAIERELANERGGAK